MPYQRPLCNETENRTNVGVSPMWSVIHRRSRCWAAIQRQLPNPDRAAWCHLSCCWLLREDSRILFLSHLRDSRSTCAGAPFPRGLFAKDTEQLAEHRTHLHNRKSERKLSIFNILCVYVKIQSLLSSGSYTGACFWMGVWLLWMYLWSGLNRGPLLRFEISAILPDLLCTTGLVYMTQDFRTLSDFWIHRIILAGVQTA